MTSRFLCIEGRTIGQVIRERRILLALTHEELARRVRTNTPFLAHLESGKRHYPTPDLLSRLSEVLELDLSEWRELYKRIG
ncbi:MAG: helix-turn-helix transcriptional regulator [Terriglobales bacterium]